MFPSNNRKLNSYQVPNALVSEQTTFCMWLFQSIKAWKTVVLGFVKHEHDIPDVVECPKSKEEKLSTIGITK